MAWAYRLTSQPPSLELTSYQVLSSHGHDGKCRLSEKRLLRTLTTTPRICSGFHTGCMPLYCRAVTQCILVWFVLFNVLSALNLCLIRIPFLSGTSLLERCTRRDKRYYSLPFKTIKSLSFLSLCDDTARIKARRVKSLVPSTVYGPILY